MGEIKSSWELAMERTASIKSDKSALRASELKEKGQKIASEYLSADKAEPKKLTQALKEYSGQEKKQVEKAVIEVLLTYISLPRNGEYQSRLDFVSEGLKKVIGNAGIIEEILQQISQFFSQYLEQREQLKEQLKQQYTPQLRRKQQSLAQQYGYEIELKHEQDPEFSQLLQKNLRHLEGQYQEALNQVKDQLRNYHSP
ncbi:MAG TPA: hypothetical protein ENN41_00090 [Sediminispirochaeta sp.]|nr:hypothetical protein [Sediminispirochaeta sp.]